MKKKLIFLGCLILTGCASNVNLVKKPEEYKIHVVRVRDCQPGKVIKGKLTFNCVEVKEE